MLFRNVFSLRDRYKMQNGRIAGLSRIAITITISHVSQFEFQFASPFQSDLQFAIKIVIKLNCNSKWNGETREIAIKIAIPIHWVPPLHV